MTYNNKILECVFIVGTYNRPTVFQKSLESFLGQVGINRLRLVVVDSSDEPSVSLCDSYDYLWLPGDVSMATARDIGYAYAKQKYVFDWVGFLEDDLVFEPLWYQALMQGAQSLYGRQSPFGLWYGVFTASPGVTESETIVFDEANDCFAEFFGPRADQRIFKASHYENVVKHWDSDLLGISSCQTGNQVSRNVMNGFCSANLSNQGLCRFVDGEESTWDGIRDIGPAAFDKRIGYYKSIVARVSQLSSNSADDVSAKVAEIKPEHYLPATQTKFDEGMFTRTKRSLAQFIKRTLR